MGHNACVGNALVHHIKDNGIKCCIAANHHISEALAVVWGIVKAAFEPFLVAVKINKILGF